MKKFLCILLVMSVLFSFFACGEKNEVSNANSNEKRTIIVALNAGFPPYEYKENGEIVGIDPDMTREIAKRLDMNIEFLDIEFDSIINTIQSGKADIAATGMTVTEDRKNYVHFTDMYQDAVQSIVVKKDSIIKGKEDLAGKIIAVQAGTTGDMYCTDEFGNDNILRFSKIIDGIQAVVIGKADACVVDDQVAKSCVKSVNDQNGKEDLIILPTAYVEEHYAMALNKNDNELYEKVNGVLNEMINDGTLKTIKEKYIKD